MDAMDLRILRAMGVGPAPHLHEGTPIEDLKPPRIAEKVGLSIPAVKDRLRAMTESGALNGAFVATNGQLYDLQYAYWLFEVPESEKRTTLARLAALPFVGNATDCVGPWVLAGYHERPDQAKARLAAVSEAAGRAPVKKEWRNPYPKPKRALTPLEARILLAMHENPLMPLPDVAEGVGVSVKTVRNKLDQLIADAAFYTRARLDRSRMPGLIFAFLDVEARDGREREAAQAVLTLAADYLVFAALPASLDIPRFQLGVATPSISTLDKICQAASDLEAVRLAYPLVPRCFHEGYPDTLAGLRQAAALPESNAPPAKERSHQEASRPP